MVMEMITNYWLAVLVGLLIGSAITATGMYLLGFRRVRRGRRTRLVPELDRRPIRVRWRQFRERLASVELRPRTFTLIVLLMALAVGAGLVQIVSFTMHQRACNAEFRSTSLELRRIGTEDRDLENQDDKLRNQRDDAWSDMLEILVTPPPPGERVDALGALNRLRATTLAIDVRRDQLYAERAALEQRRRAQPVPDERC
ncbi:hypothetical protein [Nocardia brasiliensis]|uniref:hypothetical protein n=1 Tax=Nocardia brasiliensis TaxID=37326 RepID=UPI00245851A6|nr:hypothetical protein [Nocardia brasiliensis]